jgi:hypothetical protein
VPPPAELSIVHDRSLAEVSDLVREKAIRQSVPQAEIAFDPFHVVRVRDEALLVRAGCKTPTLGCRSRPGEAEDSLTRGCGEGRGAVLTTTRHAGTIGARSSWG